jgi:hypothetical protein
MSPTFENLTFSISQVIDVKASLEDTFEALLEELGPGMDGGEDEPIPMPMKIEAWPGGRWYRDLGDNNGHFWGHVQAIKRPTLMEISGPLFSSNPCFSNIQYRLKATATGTRIEFRHLALGVMPEEHRSGLQKGWSDILNRIQATAQKSKAKAAR